MSYLTCRLQEIIPPQVREGLSLRNVPHPLQDLLSRQVGSVFIMILLMRKGQKMKQSSASRPSHQVVISIELEGSFPPFLDRLMCQLAATIQVRTQGMAHLDMMGVGTHPVKLVGRLRYCWNDEIVVEKRGPVKDGELTKPMVDVIFQVWLIV